MTATDASPAVWSGRRSRRARYLRIAGGVVLFLLIDLVAYVAGQALHSHAAAQAVRCPLTTAGVQSGRSVVTYRDGTNNARMSQAIRAAVAAWNGAPTDVALVSTQAPAALTFQAGLESRALPACRATTARSVVVTLATVQWNAVSGPHAVRDPTASIAKVIGHALGLPATGKCPALMAPKNCAHRNATPGPAEVAAVNQLYRRPG